MAAATFLGITVRARGLARESIGQSPPQRGWRMQDENIQPQATQVTVVQQIFILVWDGIIRACCNMMIQGDAPRDLIEMIDLGGCVRVSTEGRAHDHHRRDATLCMTRRGCQDKTFIDGLMGDC